MGVCGSSSCPKALEPCVPDGATGRNTNRSLSPGSCTSPTGFPDGGFHRSQFIRDVQGCVNKEYVLDGERLGAGSFGTVYRARHRSLGVDRAVKQVGKRTAREVLSCQREMQVMKMLDHPNIIRLHGCYEDRRAAYLVMEIAQGGELYDRIVREPGGRFAEASAACVMRDILQAVFYLHSRRVVHRDLKPENFMLLCQGPVTCDNQVKLIDFGAARTCEPDQTLHTLVGTHAYMAPQVLRQHYGMECDNWSAGAILYVLLCGYAPFSGRNEQDVVRKVLVGRYTFVRPVWSEVSPAALELVSALLHVNPLARYDAERALGHRWLKKEAPRPAPELVEGAVLGRFIGYQDEHRLKKASLQIIASHAPEASIREQRQHFAALDQRGDGFLTLSELAVGLRKAGVNPRALDLERVFRGVDTDRNGVVDYSEFLASTMEDTQYLDRDLCLQAFSVFDRDGDGRITAAELAEVLDPGRHPQASADILKDLDSNGDGVLDFGEFMDMMSTKRPSMPVATGDQIRRVLSEQSTVSGWESLRSLNPAASFRSEKADIRSGIGGGAAGKHPPRFTRPALMASAAAVVRNSIGGAW